MIQALVSRLLALKCCSKKMPFDTDEIRFMQIMISLLFLLSRSPVSLGRYITVIRKMLRNGSEDISFLNTGNPALRNSLHLCFTQTRFMLQNKAFLDTDVTQNHA